MTDDIVVVGASLAGGRAVETLRKSGYEGRITLIGAERERPYDRPPLSKKFLRGQLPREDLFLRPLDYYEQQRVTLRTGVRAVGLDTTAREVALDDGARVPFGALLITTGARVRKLTCRGASLEGVHYVRTLDDSERLHAELTPGKRLVVIGAGVIGAEVAASARELGLEVVMLELAPVPLARAFGADVGQRYAAFHRDRGVDVRCGVQCVALHGARRVEEVELADGTRLGCDLVVVGIGVQPDTDWLEGSDVKLDDGVVVDERAETSVKGIFAAGDVTKFYLPFLGRHVRLESVDNAQYQAACAVSNLLGKPSVYDPVPYFWSDQFDLKLQSVGHVDRYDRVIYRGTERAFAAFHVLDGALRGFVGVNRLKEMGAAKKLIAARIPVTDEQLADESFPLASLLG